MALVPLYKCSLMVEDVAIFVDGQSNPLACVVMCIWNCSPQPDLIVSQNMYGYIF